MTDSQTILSSSNLNLYYGDNQALKDVHLSVPEHQVTALIGPSGCGKSTLLRCFNRMHDLTDGVRIEGEILYQGSNILSPDTDVTQLRTQIGMVFQKPNPFPKSIFENIVFGLRLQGISNSTELQDRAEQALRGAALWMRFVTDSTKTPYSFRAGSNSG